MNAGASFHGDRAGAALSYDRFDDSSNYRSAPLGGRLSITAGFFEDSLLGRRRDMSVTAGMVDSKRYGDIGFAGLSLGISN